MKDSHNMNESGGRLWQSLIHILSQVIIHSVGAPVSTEVTEAGVAYATKKRLTYNQLPI